MNGTPYIPHFHLRFNHSKDLSWRYTPAHMAHIWDIMEGEGKIPWLFYDGGIKTRNDYIDFMTQPDVFAYVVYDRGDHTTPLATYFVNNFTGNAAMMHFCHFQAGLPLRIPIGLDACNFLLKGGGSGISALIGITPRPFRHAWRYALSVGFQQKAIIPEACRLELPNHAPRYVDAVASLCTPSTLLPFSL